MPLILLNSSDNRYLSSAGIFPATVSNKALHI